MIRLLPRTAFASITAMTFVLLTGCSDDGNPKPVANATPAPANMATAPAAALAVPVAASALPQPDPATPKDRYEALQSGNQLMFQYYAHAGLPLDYPAIAGFMSNEYRQTSDSFRQHDLLEALRPRIDAALAHAKSSPYLRMDIDMAGELSAYDFTRKGFDLKTFDDRAFRYFGDNSRYRLEFSNGTRYAFLPAADEAAARTIEGLRTKFQGLTLRVFLFINDADPSNEHVKGVITNVILMGKQGQPLAQLAASTEPVVAAPAEKKQPGHLPYGWY